MDGGAWYATVHGVAKSWTHLSDFTFTILSSNSTLSYRKKWKCIHTTCKQMFIVVLFITARNINKSNTHHINKMWHIQTMEYYSAIKKKLGTDTYHDMDKLQVKEARQETPRIVWFDLYEMSRIVKSLYGESRLGLGDVGEKWEWLLTNLEFWGGRWWKCYRIDFVVMEVLLCGYTKNYWIVHFVWIVWGENCLSSCTNKTLFFSLKEKCLCWGI